MTRERWQQVKEIFQSAIERPPSERDGFISQACADDPDLRSQVQSLISSHDEAGDSFQSVAVNLAAQMIYDDEAKSLLGHRIGPYEVTALIGRGGMGEVYLARDSRLARLVALKLLPSHITQDKQRLERFKQEARAASALNHPNTPAASSLATESWYSPNANRSGQAIGGRQGWPCYPRNLYPMRCTVMMCCGSDGFSSIF